MAPSAHLILAAPALCRARRHAHFTGRAGSLLRSASAVRLVPPCPLGIEQRIADYFAIPLAAMVLLGLSVGSSPKVITLALLAIAVAMIWNAGLGVYHSGVEWQWWQGPQDCSGAAPNFSA